MTVRGVASITCTTGGVEAGRASWALPLPKYSHPAPTTLARVSIATTRGRDGGPRRRRRRVLLMAPYLARPPPELPMVPHTMSTPQSVGLRANRFLPLVVSATAAGTCSGHHRRRPRTHPRGVTQPRTLMATRAHQQRRRRDGHDPVDPCAYTRRD